jgi:predicted RNase H-like nuclease
VTSYLGIDLAWSDRNRTGLAALDGEGRLVASSTVRTDDEIAAFVTAHAADGPVVAALDAPLVVPNATGRRDCEAQLSREFGRFHAGAHPANRSRPWFDPPRGEVLAARLGWDTDPATSPGGVSVAVEVYPHPAMVALFGLTTVIPYKQRGQRRDVDLLRVAFGDLLGHMEDACEDPLHLSASARWAEIRRGVATATRKSYLRLLEDEIDAVFCAYLAWRWGQRDPWLRVVGDAARGYIVVPEPPRAGGAGSLTTR